MAERRSDKHVIADARTAFARALGTDYGTRERRELIVEANVNAGDAHLDLGDLEQALAHYEVAAPLDFTLTHGIRFSIDRVRRMIAAKK